ncbi:MAG: MarR family transcriptional regulator [Pseudomonadota bacterium]
MPDTEIAHLTDRLMRRINATLNAKADEFDHHSVGPVGGIFLLTLAESEPARIQDLVNLTSRDKAQTTRVVQMLEQKGLIERRSTPDDARVSLLSLTSEGRKTVGTIQHAVAEALSEILAPLSSADKHDLKKILRRI